jgi:hypothetical protein
MVFPAIDVEDKDLLLAGLAFGLLAWLLALRLDFLFLS